jgi:hypothetical protein
MSRPGFTTVLEKSSPPMMFNAGDGFHYEKLPEGTRVIYPPGPVKPLEDPNVAIERALLEPMGMEPLHELLHPGMKLTIVSTTSPVLCRRCARRIIVNSS